MENCELPVSIISPLASSSSARLKVTVDRIIEFEHYQSTAHFSDKLLNTTNHSTRLRAYESTRGLNPGRGPR